MKTKYQNLIKAINKYNCLTLISKFHRHLWDHYDSLNIDEVSIEYRLGLLKDYWKHILDEPSQILPSKSEHFEDHGFKAFIDVLDDEIKLLVEDKLSGQYLESNAFLFKKDIKYYLKFGCRNKKPTIHLSSNDEGPIVIEITKDDGELYDYFKGCEDLNPMKVCLKDCVKQLNNCDKHL